MFRMIWKTIAEIGINGKIPLTIYQSNRSNLRVAVATTPGPMVSGRITFATETHSNDGLPHTLEHLVFMGSKLYPYKGVLDIIANRCLASGTNASTDQDHTAYMLTTAGSTGFLKVLPVYLDHLLMPNLTDSQYITEVYHINGKGQDSGVVYSEMQDRESEMDKMVDRKRKELFYPKGSSYAAETGGVLYDIRHLCSVERVRNYHKDFYHLRNMFITVCGKIDHEKLLNCIEPVEQRNLDSIPKDFVQPFQARIPPLNERKSAKIVCPSDDESSGMVEISWLGPPATDAYTIRALMILFDYLTDTSVAPLRKDFVQVADPFCSSVDIMLLEQRDCEIIAAFEGVPIDKLDQIQDRFFEKTINDHKDASAFDVERFGYILDQQIRIFLSKLENNPTSLIVDAIIGHQLYGQDSDPDYQQLEECLNEATRLQKLKAEPAEFWQSLLHKYLVRNCVCVMAEPSEKAIDEFTAKEEERIRKRIESLGDDGLKQCQERLDKAIFDNTHNTPTDEVLRELIVRDLEHFAMIDASISTNFSDAKGNEGTFIDDLPFPAILHTVPSDFVEATILIDTMGLSANDRHFLMLWFELMFQSPAVIDGKEVSYEEVARLATKDLVSNSVSIGVAGVYDRFISLKLRVDNEHFANLSKWAQIYLTGIRFDTPRIVICAKKLANNAAESKRDGNSVCNFLSTNSTYQPDANTRFYSHIGLEKFHKQIAKAVEGGQAKAVLDKLECVRSKVLSCPMNVHFAGDPSRIKMANGFQNQWDFLGTDNATTTNNRSFLQCPAEYGADWSLVGQSRAISVGGSESAFLVQKTQFGGDWNDPNTMATLLLAQYLVQCEGPLWCVVRGTGLAYDASIYLLPDRKALALSLYRCSQLAEAYEKTRETVLDILESGKLDERLFESAKRSLVCELVSGQSTVKLTAISALLSTIRRVGLDLTLKLCSQIWHAGPEEVLAKGGPAIQQLFDAQNSVQSIALNPARLGELKQHFPKTKILKLDELQIKEAKF